MASTVRDTPGGSVIGFAIVFGSFVFRSLIPAPSSVWLVVLAAGVLVAVKGGMSGLDLIALGLAGFMIVGSLVPGDYNAIGVPTPRSVYENTGTPDPSDVRVKEPMPVPSEYGFELDDSDHDSARLYRSKPIPAKRANAAVAEVVDYYDNGLAPGWTVVDRKEDRRSDTPIVQAKFRQGDTSNGIGIVVYALVPAEGRSAVVILVIQALNCGEDVPGLPSGEVCWQGPA